MLDLSEVPSECLVLGGGVVACELAQFLARVGSRVTILQRSPRLLKEFSEEASKAVERAMSEEGIEILTGVSLKSFQSLGREQTVVTFESEGQEQQRETGFCFLALGRSPATRGSALTKSGSIFFRADTYGPTSSSKRVFLMSMRPGTAPVHTRSFTSQSAKRDGGLSCLGKKSSL